MRMRMMIMKKTWMRIRSRKRIWKTKYEKERMRNEDND